MLTLPFRGAPGRLGSGAAMSALLLLLGFAPSPLRHAEFESSAPAAGERVTAQLDRVALRFTEAVQEEASGIRLVPAGGGEGTALDVVFDPENPAELVGLVPPGLDPGDYRVDWRTASADGHAVEGTFSFTYDFSPPAVPAAPEQIPVEGVEGEGDGMVGMDHDAERELPIFAALLRGGGVGSLAALAGLLLFGTWLTRSPDDRSSMRIARGLAVVAPLLLAGHLIAWGVSAMDPLFGITAADMIVGTLPGRVELYRLGLTVAAAVALFAGSPAFAGAFAVVAVLLSGMTGHAMSFSPTFLVPARALHIAAVSLWLGGLIVLYRTARGGDAYRAVALRVSSVALGAVIVLLLTGVAHLLVFPVELGTLVGSTYGKILMAKLLGVAVLVGFGARNRLAVVPHLPDPGAIRALRRNAALEIAVMTGVLIATGFLMYSMLPESGM